MNRLYHLRTREGRAQLIELDVQQLLAGDSSPQWRVAAVIEPKTDNAAATGSIDTREPPPMKDELQANGVRAALRRESRPE